MMKIFLSYSWDSDDHRAWVQALAEDIENFNESFEVIYDRVGMDHQVDRNFFMEQAVNLSDVMLAIVTKAYGEKANLRQGGVGRETSMAVERHFTEMGNNAKSSILVIRRESDAEIPHYLKPKLYFDFSKQEGYSSALAELSQELTAIQDQRKSCTNRERIVGLERSQDRDASSFTRTEDLVASFYRVRTPILRDDQSRDFSGERKVKYELWKVDTPQPQLLLVLFENINIKQTLEHFFERFQCIEEDLRKIRALTVLRPKSGVAGYLEGILTALGSRFEITELVFKEYLSKYCVSSRTLPYLRPFQEPFYIDQKLYRGRPNGAEDLGPALQFLKRQLSNESVSPLALLVASGGTGKTTLLRALAAQIESGGKSQPLLIEVSQLKALSWEQKRRAHISSIYELCHLYYEARKPQTSPLMSERALFELLLISGSVTILIDGVDEISSLFHENFDAHGFIDSIYSLNSELGQTRVILDIREDSAGGIISAIQNRDVPIFSLLGFTESDVQNYIQKRFAKKTPVQRKSSTTRILDYLRAVEEAHNGFSVVLPFFLDVLCEVEEESEGATQVLNVISADLDSAGYLNTGSLIDLLIFRILVRECERQSWTLPVSLLVDVLKEIASAFWGMCSERNFADTVVTLLSGAGGDAVERFRKNPLLKVSESSIVFKYDFLNSYFSALWLIELIDGKRPTELTAKHLARYSQGQGAAFEDVVRYFRSRPTEYGAERVATCYRSIKALLDSTDESHRKHGEVYKAAASATCHLLAASLGHGMNREVFSIHLLELPGIEIYDGKRRVKKLYIQGDFPTLHFTDIEVWDSEFVGYENFTKGRFERTCFYYSKFAGIKGMNCSPSFGPHVFDMATCEVGELVEVLKARNVGNDQEPRVALDEFKKFFRRFYDGGAFRRKRIDEQYKFGKPGFDSVVLEALLRSGVLEQNPKVADEFGVSKEFQRSVEKYLNENHLAKNLRSLLRGLTG